MATPKAPAKKAAAKKAPAKPAPAPAAAETVEPAETKAEALPPVDHAPLEAPAKPKEPEAPQPEPRAADGAVDLLASGLSSIVTCERTGNAPDADCAIFGDPEGGVVRAQCRLLERGVTASGRQVTRLLLAEGSEMTAAAAAELKARIRELNQD